MSWFYDVDSDSDFDSEWNGEYDYNYYIRRAADEDIYPLDYHPFRQLVDACIGYTLTQEEVPLYDAALFAFLDIVACAVGAMAYERELKFHTFITLPPELRLNIYGYYLDSEQTAARQKTQLQVDGWGHSCCAWGWPFKLALCDRHSIVGTSTATFAPWLPSLAFTNKQLHDEVAIYMLKTTAWFEFNYCPYKAFKIVPWFASFLSTFPNDEAFNAIKRLSFPQLHEYNFHRRGKVIDEKNPDVQLMLRCKMLSTAALSFGRHTLTYHNRGEGWKLFPRDLSDLLDYYQLRPMLQHKQLKEIHLKIAHGLDENIMVSQALDTLGKWIIQGFRKNGRDVKVCVQKGHMSDEDVVYLAVTD